MATKPTMMLATGVFLVTTVLFAAAIVISHALSIPEPTQRFLPSAARDLPTSPSSERPDDVELTNDILTDTASPSDEPVATVTAMPEPPSTVSAAADTNADAADGTSTAGADNARPAAGPPPAAPPSRQATAPSARPDGRQPNRAPSPKPEPPSPEPTPSPGPTPTEPSEPAPSESASPPASGPSESVSPPPSEPALPREASEPVTSARYLR